MRISIMATKRSKQNHQHNGFDIIEQELTWNDISATLDTPVVDSEILKSTALVAPQLPTLTLRELESEDISRFLDQTAKSSEVDCDFNSTPTFAKNAKTACFDDCELLPGKLNEIRSSINDGTAALYCYDEETVRIDTLIQANSIAVSHLLDDRCVFEENDRDKVAKAEEEEALLVANLDNLLSATLGPGINNHDAEVTFEMMTNNNLKGFDVDDPVHLIADLIDMNTSEMVTNKSVNVDADNITHVVKPCSSLANETNESNAFHSYDKMCGDHSIDSCTTQDTNSEVPGTHVNEQAVIPAAECIQKIAPQKKSKKQRKTSHTKPSSELDDDQEYFRDQLREKFVMQKSLAERMNSLRRSVDGSAETTLPVHVSPSLNARRKYRNVDDSDSDSDLTISSAEEDENEILCDLTTEIEIRKLTLELLLVLHSEISIERCKEILAETDQMDITVDILVQYPFLGGIVDTCCRLDGHNSDADFTDVRRIAESARAKMMALFPRISADESFLHAFDRKVAEYRRAVAPYAILIKKLVASRPSLSDYSQFHQSGSYMSNYFREWDNFYIEYCDPDHELIHIDDDTTVADTDELLNVDTDIKPDIGFLMASSGCSNDQSSANPKAMKNEHQWSANARKKVASAGKQKTTFQSQRIDIKREPGCDVDDCQFDNIAAGVTNNFRHTRNVAKKCKTIDPTDALGTVGIVRIKTEPVSDTDSPHGSLVIRRSFENVGRGKSLRNSCRPSQVDKDTNTDRIVRRKMTKCSHIKTKQVHSVSAEVVKVKTEPIDGTNVANSQMTQQITDRELATLSDNSFKRKPGRRKSVSKTVNPVKVKEEPIILHDISASQTSIFSKKKLVYANASCKSAAMKYSDDIIRTRSRSHVKRSTRIQAISVKDSRSSSSLPPTQIQPTGNQIKLETSVVSRRNQIQKRTSKKPCHSDTPLTNCENKRKAVIQPIQIKTEMECDVTDNYQTVKCSIESKKRSRKRARIFGRRKRRKRAISGEIDVKLDPEIATLSSNVAASAVAKRNKTGRKTKFDLANIKSEPSAGDSNIDALHSIDAIVRKTRRRKGCRPTQSWMSDRFTMQKPNENLIPVDLAKVKIEPDVDSFAEQTFRKKRPRSAASAKRREIMKSKRRRTRSDGRTNEIFI